ncbi:VOC family protein [Methyloligella sp. 2.7D]|uniref:VOC family protein n=1 Tax=unclassified Methyloligella TaxID=2625955 RepID=UPI00157D445A|nr:VOC family protein [Methyloligella sp. GL2]QKP77161.1 VOC family protein [Methyloligella sp. GL2]
MFSYMMIGSNDLARSIAFYDPVMEVLGHPRIYLEETDGAMWGKPDPGPHIMLATPFDEKPATVGNGMMISFLAESRAMVDRFYEAALANGGSDEGPPGLRLYYGPSFYAAYVRDPDGNKLNAVCYEAEEEE